MGDTWNTDRLADQRAREGALSIPSTRDGVDDVTPTGGSRSRYQPYRAAEHDSRRTAERIVEQAALRDRHVDTGGLDVFNRRTLGRRIN